MTSTVPPHPVPAVVRELAGTSPVAAVWLNGIGGVTYRIGPPDSPTDDIRFVKWQPHDPEASLAAEAERLRWARHHTVVPRVLDVGGDADAEWLVSAACIGSSAVEPRWLADPAVAVRGVGRGLRMLHHRLPVETCPWTWTPADRVADARRRDLDIADALLDHPPVDHPVVCQADACCPNTLLDESGFPCAHVDLGRLGVADRWADIAVAAMSTEWNYGPGWEGVLLEAYGVEPDPARMTYYRRLWNDT